MQKFLTYGLHGFVSRCDPIEARLRKAPTSTFPARERSLSPTSRYALFPGETDKVKHWGVSNGLLLGRGS
jgi:hypothetical protein